MQPSRILAVLLKEGEVLDEICIKQGQYQETDY